MSKGLEVGKAMSLSLNNRLALRLRPFGPAPGVIPGRNGRLARELMKLGFDSMFDASARGQADWQLMPDLISLGADPAQLGSLPVPDTNDPWWIHDGTRRVIFSEAQIGDCVGATVPVIPEGAVTQIEAACLMNSDTPAVGRGRIGTDFHHFFLQFLSDRRLSIAHIRVVDTNRIGGANSPDPLPVDAPPRVWLRARLTIDTALCEYWWSPQQVRSFGEVTDWRSLGSVVGAHAGSSTRAVRPERIIGTSSTAAAPADGEYLAAYWHFTTTDGDIIHQWDAEDLDRSNPDADHVSHGTTWQIVRAS